MRVDTRQAIARIDVVAHGESRSRGTGFLVTERLVLTALHVVADRQQSQAVGLAQLPGEIEVSFPSHSTTARVVDGCWDAEADWALLSLAEPPGALPLPLAEGLSGDWETFGFPDANPRDGMVQSGTLEDQDARLDGVPALQLLSRQAAAGQGAPVSGLSGAPVLIDGAVVGLLRFALMEHQKTVAGTLYACPISSILEKAGDLLPVPDPCHGLPGLRRSTLPTDPFRYLEPFTAQDAEVFFGRNRDLRALYDRVTAQDGAPLVLLYGQSGVGKSSFLAAGLIPRLEWSHHVLYLRRDAEVGLAESLRARLVTELEATAENNTGSADCVSELWQQLEATCGKPVVLVFDQMEEVFTAPHLERPHDLRELVTEISSTFGDESDRPEGRIVLAFRKEWYPEVHKQVELAHLPFSQLFLEGLDREAIVEAVEGLTSTERLRESYGLEIEDGLAETIAGVLLEDPGSPIAPQLQILLTKMWREARAESAHAPRFSLDLYRRLKEEGLLLVEFLDQQLTKLQKRHPTLVDSGLALDLLAFHTSDHLTSQERSRDALLTQYGHLRDDALKLLSCLSEEYLLVDNSENRESSRDSSRLAHDTLASHVRQRFDESERPGQRGRRILESRAAEWQDGQEGAPLDGFDLALVEQGQSGMRVWTADERRLVEVSAVRWAKKQRQGRLLRGALYVAASLVLIASVIAFFQRGQAIQSKERADVRRDQAEDLIGFMLGDLREKLEPVGRLDVLDGVGEKAMEYFAAVPAEELSDDELAGRSQALYQLGDVRIQQGNLPEARKAFEESRELAEALVDRDPSNDNRLFDLGQSYYWTGYVDRESGDLEGAERQWRQYLRISTDLATRSITNTDWRLELAYAHQNLAVVARDRGDLDRAIESVQKSLLIKNELVAARPEEARLLGTLANGTSWLGTLQLETGSLVEASQQFEKAAGLRRSLSSLKDDDPFLGMQLARSLAHLAEVRVLQGKQPSALELLGEACDLAREVVELDPTNLVWQRDLGFNLGKLGQALIASGRPAEARSHLFEARRIHSRLVEEDPSNLDWLSERSFVLSVLSQLHLVARELSLAQVNGELSVDILESLARQAPNHAGLQRQFAAALLVLSEAQEVAGDRGSAFETRDQALQQLGAFETSRDLRIGELAVLLLAKLNRQTEASVLADRLLTAGYLPQAFLAKCRSLGLPSCLTRDNSLARSER